MQNNYRRIAAGNLERLYARLPEDQAERMGAIRHGDRFRLTAFGHPCTLSQRGVERDGGRPLPEVPTLLASLYALHARNLAICLQPFRAFKELPGSMPYGAAFATHTERILAPHVERWMRQRDRIRAAFDGTAAPQALGGDLSLVLRPLPKIALCFIGYRADEEFPAAVTCLFSANADRFMPIDGLADVGEYTAREIISRLE